MLTFTKPNGEWELKTFDIKEVPRGLYGYIAKLHNYEKCGFSPDELQSIIDELAESRNARRTAEEQCEVLKKRLEEQFTATAFLLDKLNRIRELIQEAHNEQK